MAFPVKEWENFPSQATPLNAEALKDMERRVSEHAENVAAFLIFGGGTGDDSALVQAILDNASVAGGGTVRGARGVTYTCESVEIPAGVILDLTGCTFKHKAGSITYCVRLNGEGAQLINGSVDGNSPNLSADVVPVQVAASRTLVRNVKVYDGEYHCIQVTNGASDVKILYNWCYKKNAATASRHLGIALHSTSAADACTDVLVQGNHVRDTTMSGLGVNGVAKRVVWDANVTVDTGEDGIAAYDRANEYLLACNNSVHSPANNGIHLGGKSPAAMNNTCNDVTFRGIFLSSDPNADPTPSTGAIAEGNTINGTTNALTSPGVSVQRYTGVSVTGNTSLATKLSNYEFIDCTEITFTGNTGRGSISGHGARFAGCVSCTATGNTLMGSAGHGVTIVQHTRPDATVVQSSDITVVGNTIRGHAGFGVQSANLSDWVLVDGNNLRGNTSGATSLVGANNKITADNFT